MTLYTSDIDKRLYSAGVKYLIAAAAVAAAGAVYEIFSHGVYSYYMIYAFMVPLAGGAIPCLLAAAGGKKRRASGPGSSLSAKLQLAAVATLTAGSLMKGVLEIYGTTNRLTVIYAAAGLALAAAALITFALPRLWPRGQTPWPARRLSFESSQYEGGCDPDQYAGGDAAE